MEPSKLAEALSKVQAKLKPVLKESDNPFFKSKYANLPSVCEVVLPLLAEQGLAVTQEGEFRGDNFVLRTTLRHSSGETINSLWPIAAKDGSAQAIGSGSTYARRYSLMALVGVSAEDDDGELAEGRAPQNTAQGPAKSVQPLNYAPVTNPGDYQIKFGKWVGVKLKDMKDSDLQKELTWAKSVKDPKPGLVEFARQIEAHLKPAPTIDTEDQLPF